MAGLAVGDTDGLFTGEAVAVGVALAGLFSDAGVHAPKKAAVAAKTISRIDLLIVFSSKQARFCGLSG